MALDLAYERYQASVNTIELGSIAEEGGTRVHVLKVSGQTSFPCLSEEGSFPNPTLVGLEIFDCEPIDWPDALKNKFGDCIKDPIMWAKKCVEEFGSKFLCVRLASGHPDWGARSPQEISAFLKSLLKEIRVPLVVIGCGDIEKDNMILPKASEAVKNEKCLFGIATQNSYKTLTASCLADGHSIIAESPIDVNIAKQVNILISDMGLDPRRIVMHPTTAALGYGMEYVYSIMERARLAAFSGDKMLSMPFILFTGQEVWRVKEAKEFSEAQGVNWEIATAVSMIHSGGDILVMRHPDAARSVTKYIDAVMRK